MTRFFLKLALVIALVYAVIFLGIRILSHAPPADLALRGFYMDCEDKPQPCWYGIVLGTTGIEQARYLIAKAGLEGYELQGIEGLDNAVINLSLGMTMCPLVSITSENDTVVSIEVSYECNNHDPQIGDVAAILGMPTRMTFGRYDPPVYEMYYGGATIDPEECSGFTDKVWKFTLYPPNYEAYPMRGYTRSLEVCTKKRR